MMWWSLLIPKLVKKMLLQQGVSGLRSGLISTLPEWLCLHPMCVCTARWSCPLLSNLQSEINLGSSHLDKASKMIWELWKGFFFHIISNISRASWIFLRQSEILHMHTFFFVLLYPIFLCKRTFRGPEYSQELGAHLSFCSKGYLIESRAGANFPCSQ